MEGGKKSGNGDDRQTTSWQWQSSINMAMGGTRTQNQAKQENQQGIEKTWHAMGINVASVQ